MITHRHRPVRALISQLPMQHAIHDLWWCQKARKRGVFTPWNDSAGVFFIHVPKCAGTSVYKSLHMPKPALGSHIPIKAYFAENASKAAQMDSFTFVRNPWDRFVSAFHYLAFHAKGKGDQSFAKSVFSDTPNFQTFANRFTSENYYRRTVMSHPHFRPQSHYLFSADRQLKPKLIFRVEDGLDQLSIVSKKIGIDFKLSSLNCSDREQYREYFSSKTAPAIEHIYAADVTLLSYAF